MHPSNVNAIVVPWELIRYVSSVPRNPAVITSYRQVTQSGLLPFLCVADKKALLCALAFLKTRKVPKPYSRRAGGRTTIIKMALKRRPVKSSPRKVIRCPAPFGRRHHLEDNQLAPKRNQARPSLKDVSAHSSESSSPTVDCGGDGTQNLYKDGRFGNATGQDSPNRWFTDSLPDHSCWTIWGPRTPSEPLGRYTLRDEKNREVRRSTRIAKTSGR